MTVAGGGASKQQSSQKLAKLTGSEKKFAAINLEASKASLQAFLGQAQFQRLQQGLASGSISELGDVEDFLSAIPASERAELSEAEFGRARQGVDLLGTLAGQEQARIEGGIPTGLTPEQDQRIGAAETAAIEAGLNDIRSSSSDQLGILREELAPGLGLRSTDSPILDRGGLIAREGIRASQNLVSNVRAQGAQQRLQLPQQERQLGLSERGFSAGLGQAAASTAEAFRQRAFENRLALTGQAGSQGLGLASSFNTVAAQAAQRPDVLTQSTGKSKNAEISSIKFKNLFGPMQTQAILAAVRALALHEWRYKGHTTDHVGPTAEDFQASFKVGDGESIAFIDAIGVLFGAVKELAAEVSELREAEA